MAATLKVVDEVFGTGAPVRRPGVNLRLASERASAREILRSRVTAEVEELNQRPAEGGATRSYLVNVEASSPEAKLNSFLARHRKPKPLDVAAEVKRAVTAFERRRFIMLLDDRQIDDLDEALGLRPESEVVFVHLTPLKGG
jgi:hypothetical protein